MAREHVAMIADDNRHGAIAPFHGDRVDDAFLRAAEHSQGRVHAALPGVGHVDRGHGLQGAAGMPCDLSDAAAPPIQRPGESRAADGYLAAVFAVVRTAGHCPRDRRFFPLAELNAVGVDQMPLGIVGTNHQDFARRAWRKPHFEASLGPRGHARRHPQADPRPTSGCPEYPARQADHDHECMVPDMVPAPAAGFPTGVCRRFGPAADNAAAGQFPGDAALIEVRERVAVLDGNAQGFRFGPDVQPGEEGYRPA